MKNEVLLNRYKVIDKLGEGGMGSVWRVYDEVLGKELALKEIKLKSEADKMPAGSRLSIDSTGTYSSAAELRFAEEFRTMTKLQYPYIVKVYDYGVLTNGSRYIVMEIVEGMTLKEYLKAGNKLTFQEMYRILIQLSQTLNFIHSRLYVHRDIKSENIMINENKDIKLMDFGLMDRLGIVCDGTTTGTIQYIPPEVFKGGVINESSDLYSVGCLAYEMVAGKCPFLADKIIDVIRMQINDHPQPLSEINPEINPEFEKIIFKLLEKDQSERYTSASELAEDLSKISDEKISIETVEQKRSYLFCSKLIGRDEESQKLKDHFDKVLQGSGVSVFIAAPAGVGKSRLIQEFRVEAQLSDVRFFDGICVEQGMSAYQPFRVALKPLLRLTKKSVMQKYGPVLVKVFPELENSGYTPLPSLDEYGEKARIFENVSAWLREMSKDSKLVICIDDLHWSDHATIDIMNACIRELKDCPIMFLGAFRDDEVEEVSPVLHTIEERETDLLKIEPLNQEHVVELIRSMLGHVELNEDVLNQVFTVTGGNPFFVSETMRTLIEDEKLMLEHGKWKLTEDLSNFEFPTTIEGTIMRRLKLLSEEALGVLQISSVMGKELDLLLIREIGKIDQNIFFGYIDELIERQFIIKEEKHYLFTHDRVRETLYSQLEDEQKKHLHQEAGSSLEKRYKTDIGSSSNLLAYHYKNGLDMQKAVKYLLMYGDRMRSKSMYAEAINIYEEAIIILETIDYPEKDKILFYSRKKILFMLSHAIKPETCIDCVNKVYGVLYEKGGGIKAIKKAVKVMKFMMGMTDKMPNVIKFWVFNKFNIDYDPLSIPKKFDYLHIVTNLVELGFFNAAALFFLGRNKECLDILQDLEDNWLPITHNGIGYACLLAARGNPFCGTGAFGIGFKEAKEACETFEKYSPLSFMQKYLQCSANFWVSNMKVHGGGHNLESYREKTYELAEKYSFMDWVGWQSLNDHMVPALHGRPKEAEAGFNHLMDISKKMGRPYGLESYANIWHSHFNLERGEFDKANYEVAVVRRLEKQDYGTQIAYADVVECRILMEQEKTDEALALLEGMLEKIREGDLSVLADCQVAIAEIYLKKGRVDEALSLADEAHQRVTSDRYYHMRYQIMTKRVLGLIHIKKKNYEQAKQYLQEALAVAEETDNMVHQGLIHLAFAELYLNLTQYTSVKESLAKSKEIFNEIENKFQLKKIKAFEEKYADHL